MMKKERSASWKRLATLAIVPMFGLFLWASAEPNYVMEDLLINTHEETSLEIDTVKPDESKTNTLTVKVDNSDNNLWTFLHKKDDVKKALIIADRQNEVKLEDIDKEDIISVVVLKDKQDIEKYGVKGKNGVVLITTKKGEEKSTALKGKIIGVKSEGADNKNVLKGEVTVIEHGKQAQKGAIPFDADSKGNMKDALLFVDGKRVPSIDDIRVEDVESFSVLKDKSATDAYGEEGENGVILIETKNNIRDALIFVDGKKVANFDDIDKDNIGSISVLKDKSATDAYGEEGKNGVVLVETKKNKILLF